MCVEWGVSLQRKAHVRQQYSARGTRIVWNGGFISNSIHRKIVWDHPKLCGKGDKSEMKVHTIWVFSNFHFRACYYAFWLRRPPGGYVGQFLNLFMSVVASTFPQLTTMYFAHYFHAKVVNFAPYSCQCAPNSNVAENLV